MLSLPEHVGEWQPVLQQAAQRGWLPSTWRGAGPVLVDARVLEAGVSVPPSPHGAVVYLQDPKPQQVARDVRRWAGFREAVTRQELLQAAGWQALEYALDPSAALRAVQLALADVTAGATPLGDAQRLLLQELHRGSIKQIAALKYTGADPAHTFAKVFSREGRTSPRVVLYALQCTVYASVRERGFTGHEAAQVLGTTGALWKRTLQQTLQLTPVELGQIPSHRWLTLSRRLLDGAQLCQRASELPQLLYNSPVAAIVQVR
jgi:predicted ATPase